MSLAYFLPHKSNLTKLLLISANGIFQSTLIINDKGIFLID